MSGPTPASPPASPLRLALQPRHWATGVGLALLYLIVISPRAVRGLVATLTGSALYRLVKRRRRITSINIKLAFPRLSTQDRTTLVKKHFRSMAHALIELGQVWWLDLSQRDSWFTIHGMENLDRARSQGGVLLVSAHFASWEISGNYLGQRIGMAASFRSHENPLIDSLLLLGRSRNLSHLYEREDIRGMVRHLKQGGILWYASDQNFGHKGSEFVDFCGVPAATNTAASRIARITGASVVPYFPIRRGTGRYELHIFPALEGFPSGDAAADARAINEAIERAVEMAPEQYFWSHRRYKDRPNGEPRFY
ncbi:MAG: lipid A biosynthesis lauroyl acyltransferase [Gammaproteobacteria bacterium]